MTMDDLTFEKCLEALNSEDILQSSVLSIIAIENVSAIFQGDLTSIEATVYTASAFSCVDGIPNFISNVLHRGAAPVKESFELMEYIVENFSRDVELMANDVLLWCTKLVTNVISNDTKSHLMKLASSIINNCSCFQIDFERVFSLLKSFLITDKKTPPSLIETIFNVIGSIFKLRPEISANDQDWFFNLIVTKMNEYRHSKNVSDILLIACFKGLCGILVNFPPNNPECYKTIYVNLKLSSILKETGERNTIGKSALAMFTSHGSYFSDSIYSEYKEWHNVLLAWIEPNTTTHIKQVGHLALTKYYKIITAHIRNLNPDNGNVAFYYFQNYFSTCELFDFYKLKDQFAGMSEFYDIYTKYQADKKLVKTMNNMINIVQSMSENNPSLLGMQLIAVSKIKTSYRNGSRLCKLAVSVFDVYPKVDSTFQPYLLESLENSFVSWYLYSAIETKIWLDTISYQGLLISSAYPIYLDIQLIDDSKNQLSYKSFVKLWTFLLTVSSRCNHSVSSQVGKLLFESFVLNYLKIVKKLDLSLNTIAEDSFDPSISKQAKNPNDFQIFVNLVDLFQDIIPLSDTYEMRQLMSDVVLSNIKLSINFPLISGFYKILATCFKISGKEELLEPNDFNEIISFIKGAVQRLNLQKDDLLIANLRMILFAPVNILETLLPHLDTVIITGTRIGRNYPDILELCIDSLEIWKSKFFSGYFDSFLRKVLPYLSSILLNPTTSQSVPINTESKIKSLKSGGVVRKRLVGPTEKKIAIIQQKLLLFISKLDPQLSSDILEPASISEFSDGSLLNYKIPLPDSRLLLPLNSLLPRIIELAASSTERNIRITACELLHGILLIGVARSRDPNNNTNLLKTMLRTAVMLSCDSDMIIRDLFNPLLTQITHYFSSQIHINSKEAGVLIEILMDGVTHSYDYALRDFSALCLREFVVWSGRQLSAEYLSVSPYNTQAVLRMICDYALHPDRCKRIGAAIAFNKLYNEFREDKNILNLFWIRVYYCFICCLELCYFEEDAEVVLTALHHIQRPLLQQSQMFLTCPPNRRVPPGIDGGTLKDLAIFSFNHCKSTNQFLRDYSMSFIKNILTHLPENPSLKEFVITSKIPVVLTESCEDNYSKDSAVLHYIFWLITENIVEPKDVTINILQSSLKLLTNLLKNNSTETNSIVILCKCLCLISPELRDNVITELATYMKENNCTQNNAEVNHAYAQLVSTVKNSIYWSLFISHLPNYEEENIIKHITEPHLMNYAWILTILDKANCLNLYYSGNNIIISIFDCLFKKKGNKIICVSLNKKTIEHLKIFILFCIKHDLNTQMLIELLCDNSEVFIEGSKKTKGRYFFDTFKSVIVPFLVRQPETTGLLRQMKIAGIDWVVIFLQHLRDTNKDDHNIKDFSFRIFNEWDLWVQSIDNKWKLFEVLRRLSQINGYKTSLDLSCLSSWYYDIPNDPYLEPEDILSFFEVLPSLISYLETENIELSKALTTIEKKWLLFKKGVNKNSPMYTTSQLVIESLLICLKNTCSLVVWKFTLESITHNLKMANDVMVNNAIQATVKCPINHIISVLEILFNFLFNELVEIKSVKFVETIVTSLLNNSVLSVSIRFCELFLPKLLKILEFPLTERKERDLVRKISATNITHVLYSLTTREERVKIQEYLMQVDLQYKDVFQKIIKTCEFGRIKSSGMNENEKELLRLLNCSCVNFMCLFVSLAPDEKYYQMFLFHKNLWVSVVDDSVEYNITMDFKKIPQIKTVPTSIESSSKIQENDHKKLIKYAQSHGSTLFQSSLSEDLRNFDLTNASIVAIENSTKITFELELDMLNQHEIVPMICAVIRHMKVKRYNSWIRHLLNSLENGSKNVKLIILKIIHNLKDDVKEFYSECSPVILKSIIKLFESMPVNYLFVDLINMLIDWKPPLSSEAISLTQIIKCFISKVNSQRRDIIKYVFNIIKNIMEEWNHLIISSEIHNFLMDQLNSPHFDEIICYIHINLASILLANNLFSLNEEDCSVLLIWLQQCMRNKKNSQMAAEACGQLLQKCSNTNFFNNLYEQVRKNIQDVQKSSTTNDITLLYHIHKFFPAICNDFTALLISRSWHDRSQQKQLSLEMLLCYVTSQSCLHDAELNTCFNIFATDILKCNIIPAQELILKIIIEVLPTLNKDTIFTLMPNIIILSTSRFIELRNLSCQILMKFYKFYNDKQLSSSCDDIMLSCKTALIDRINDTDGDLQNKCLSFWCDLNIPKLTKDRLQYILTDLYSTQAETELVEYATRLLLQSTSLSPDYNLEIFDHPLTDCSYNELKLLVSWRARYSSLAPMFVPSIATELGRLNTYMPDTSTVNFRLRETARSLMFTPTLASNNEFPSTQEIDNNESNVEFKKPNKPVRFYRNTSSGYFAKRAVATKERTKATHEEKLKERDSNVTIYRSYRVGDFPDIQIKNSQFMTLLVAMVGKDVQFAKELFILLVTSIINENSGNNTYKINLTDGLDYFLKNSDASHSVSIGAIFQIALNNNICLDCDEISRVSGSSQLLSAGVLLLECSSFTHIRDEITAVKRRRMAIPNESSWLRVAQFYHEMQDFDALRGIFLDKLSADGYSKEAILSESIMDWSTAAKNYRNTLTDNLDSDRKNFFNQSYLNCLANLSDWRKIKECIDESVSHDPNQIWNNSWCLDVILPWHLRAEMMASLTYENHEFQNLMITYQNDPEKAKKMSSFLEEITIAHWLNENVGKTISSMHKCFTNFLTNWSNISQWDKQLKMSLLSKLKVLSEVHCITNISTYFVQMQDTSEISNYFGEEFPSKQSNLLTWDVRLNLRNKLLTNLKNKSMDCDLGLLSDNINNAYLNIIHSAIQQGNFHLAKKYWKLVESKELSTYQETRWRHFKNLIRALKVKKNEMTGEQKILEYCNIIDNVEMSLDSAMTVDGLEINVIPAKRTILNITSEMIEECVDSNINYSFIELLPIDKRNLKDFWLKSAKTIIEQPINNENIIEISNTYVEMSKFCRSHNAGSSETIVKYLLKAMQCGNNEAKELFASITTMNDLIESEELENECQKVPTWMFLKWRHQFVAHLANKPKTLIKNILKRIAEKYPESLSYGLRISKENFDKSLNVDRYVKELTSMVLNNPVQESFVEAIGRLANPLHKIKYYIDKINTLLEDSNSNKEEIDNIINIIKNIVSDTDLNENFRVLSFLKNNIEILKNATNSQDIKLAVENIIISVKNADNKGSKKRAIKLANYSQWLRKFNWLKDNMLEIPGQFDGVTEPNVSQHIRVAFFKQDVVIMNSQREPIKITIVGSNAKEYSFLIKFGEDIRQDERVQQLFGQMNSVLRSNKSTSHLKIDGYGVIPLTTSYGLIQWVESVKSLSQIMSIPREDISKVFEKHINFLQTNPTNLLKAYMSAFLNKNNNELINSFQNCVTQFDSECLRKGLYRLSTTPEKFYWLRTNFATSMGAMNIAHWVLGVGDRHLENILISTDTGRVLGIDFGMAFGFATQFLPLPELIPFRLTPQILNVLKPFNESGWLKQTMINCMRAFKDDSYILLAILEVFVLEPCLDWVQQAKRLSKEQDESTSFPVKWYGQTKVRGVEEKLKGGNPVKLLEADLESGRIKDDCLLRLKMVSNGLKDSTRFNQPVSGLTPEEQVDSLIDLATDPLVLSLTYAGWSPWL